MCREVWLRTKDGRGGDRGWEMRKVTGNGKSNWRADWGLGVGSVAKWEWGWRAGEGEGDAGEGWEEGWGEGGRRQKFLLTSDAGWKTAAGSQHFHIRDMRLVYMTTRDVAAAARTLDLVHFLHHKNESYFTCVVIHCSSGIAPISIQNKSRYAFVLNTRRPFLL